VTRPKGADFQPTPIQFLVMRRLLLVLAALALLGGCGSEPEPAAEHPAPTAPAAEHPASRLPAPPLEPAQPAVADPALELVARELPPRVQIPPAPGCSLREERRMRTPTRAYAAVARGRTVAYARPGGEQLRVFGRLNVNDYPMVFGVLAAVLDESCRPAWYRVQLPIRPNGSIGYVRASDVTIALVEARIEIDLSERRLDYYERGRRVLRAITAVGAPITPTPTGRYYVNQRLVAGDPWGPFGPAALGISAFSPVLQDWVQGGPIAIHGTNDPGSVGQAASHGCLRVANETLLWLFERTPAGTPVVIRA
jgi:hypothetical protein